ncbi:MAG: succinate dehydrogenase, cytochrome b556 subunit [Mycobacterium leprae]
MTNAEGKRDVRVYADLKPRYYRTGMWSHVLHRISGIAITLFLMLHIWEVTSVMRGGSAEFDTRLAALKTPVFVVGEWLLFLAVVFHGINGVRLMLHDLGWGVRKQRSLFWTVFILSAVGIVAGSYAFILKFLAI